MAKVNLVWFACVMSICLVLSACEAPKQYHPLLLKAKNGGYRSCNVDKGNERTCENSAIQRYAGYTQLPECNADNESGNPLPDIPDAPYTLGFIEFNDQGLLHERRQMQAVLNTIKDKNTLTVVFMHGWQHNSAPTDCNIDTFKNVLSRLSNAEKINKEPGTIPREVIGVYLGWRGASLTFPGLTLSTFWDRKNTAEKVGHVGLAEVLTRLEEVKNEANRTKGNNSKLIVIGHSFGAAAVHEALSQILEARFVRSSDGANQKTPIEGFGDLVVLINPAFEALSFTPLSDMSTERTHYSPSQLPILAILTSKTDWATKYAFPLGRRFSMLWDYWGEDKTPRDRLNPTRCGSNRKQWETINEAKANVTAIGHFRQYRTHNLSIDESSSKDSNNLSFRKVYADWKHDYPGSSIAFTGGAVLTRTKDSAGQNPYLLVSVDPAIIAGHNDISQDELLAFIKQLIVISSAKEDLAYTGPQPPEQQCLANHREPTS